MARLSTRVQAWPSTCTVTSGRCSRDCGLTSVPLASRRCRLGGGPGLALEIEGADERDAHRADGDVDGRMVGRADHRALRLDGLVLEVLARQPRVDDLHRARDAFGLDDALLLLALLDGDLDLLALEHLGRRHLG